MQIYCDFSGYSEMAIAVAGLLGYRLARNFNAPYLACDITDFWRRWHISLSGWLRDYLYIPLGGNRHGPWMTYRNMMLTMLLGGLWHGAAWTFVVWGFMHGLALGVHKAWMAFRERAGLAALPPLMGLSITLYWVCIAWIFFRAADFATAWTIVEAFVLFQTPGTADLPAALYIAFFALAALHQLWRQYELGERILRLRDDVFALAGGAAAAVATALVPVGYQPFIYFQF